MKVSASLVWFFLSLLATGRPLLADSHVEAPKESQGKGSTGKRQVAPSDKPAWVPSLDKAKVLKKQTEILDRLGQRFGFASWEKPCEAFLQAAEVFRENDFTHPRRAFACSKDPLSREVAKVADEVEGEAIQQKTAPTKKKIRDSLAHRTAIPGTDAVNPPLLPAEAELKKRFPKDADRAALQKEYKERLLQYWKLRISVAVLQKRDRPFPETDDIKKKLEDYGVNEKLAWDLNKKIPETSLKRFIGYQRNLYFGSLAGYYKRVGLSSEGYLGLSSDTKPGKLVWCVEISDAECTELGEKLKEVEKRVKACRYEGSALAKRFPTETDYLSREGNFVPCTTKTDLLDRLSYVYEQTERAKEQLASSSPFRPTMADALAGAGLESYLRERNAIEKTLFGARTGLTREPYLEDWPEAFDKKWLQMTPDAIRIEAKNHSASDLSRLIAIYEGLAKEKKKSDPESAKEYHTAATRLRSALPGLPSARTAKALLKEDLAKAEALISRLPLRWLRELAAHLPNGPLKKRIERAIRYPRVLREILDDKEFGYVADACFEEIFHRDPQALARLWALQAQRDRAMETDHKLRTLISLRGNEEVKLLNNQIAKVFAGTIQKINLQDWLVSGGILGGGSHEDAKSHFRPILGYDGQGKVVVKVIGSDYLFKLQVAHSLLDGTILNRNDSGSNLCPKKPLIDVPTTASEQVKRWFQLHYKRPGIKSGTRGTEDGWIEMATAITLPISIHKIGLKVAIQTALVVGGISLAKQGSSWLYERRKFDSWHDVKEGLAEAAKEAITGVALAPIVVLTGKKGVLLATLVGVNETYDDVFKKGESLTAFIDLGVTLLAAEHLLGHRGHQTREPIGFRIIDDKIVVGKWEGGTGSFPKSSGLLILTPEGKIKTVIGRSTELPELKKILSKDVWKGLLAKDPLWKGLADAELAELAVEPPHAHLGLPDREEEKKEGKTKE